jgi:hypothetical protein
MSPQIVLSIPSIRQVADYYKFKIPRTNVTKEYLIKRLVKGNILNASDPYTNVLEKYKIITSNDRNKVDETKTQIDL